MNKILLTILMMLGIVGASLSQVTETIKPEIGLMYGINNTITPEFGIETSNKVHNYGILIGTSISLDKKSPELGYNKVILIPNQIQYEKEYNNAVYVSPTYRYERLQLGFRIGVSRFTEFKDVENRGYSLANDNLIYIKEKFLTTYTLYGFSIGLNVTDDLKVMFAHDSFNDVNLGIRIKL